MTTSYSGDINIWAKVAAVIILIAAVVFVAVCFTTLIRNLTPKMALVCMLAGTVVALAALLFIIIPQSPLSLFAPSAGTGRSETSPEDDGALTVRIREDSIYLGHIRMENETELVARILDSAGESDVGVVVCDDYALASTWNEVTAALDDKKIVWREEALK